MARQNPSGGMDNIVTIALLGVGGYFLYQWLSSSGMLAQFGIGTPVPAPQPAMTPQAIAQLQMTAAPSQPANAYPSVYVQPPVTAKPAVTYSQPVAPPVTPVSVPASAPTVSPASLKAAILSASAGDPAVVNGLATADVWDYYRNAIAPPPLSGAQFGAAFPVQGATMTLDQFISALQGAGLAGLGSIVPVASVNSLPTTMSFGGSRNAFSGRGNRGGYLQ